MTKIFKTINIFPVLFCPYKSQTNQMSHGSNDLHLSFWHVHKKKNLSQKEYIDVLPKNVLFVGIPCTRKKMAALVCIYRYWERWNQFVLERKIWFSITNSNKVNSFYKHFHISFHFIFYSTTKHEIIQIKSQFNFGSNFKWVLWHANIFFVNSYYKIKASAF